MRFFCVVFHRTSPMNDVPESDPQCFSSEAVLVTRRWNVVRHASCSLYRGLLHELSFPHLYGHGLFFDVGAREARATRTSRPQAKLNQPLASLYIKIVNQLHIVLSYTAKLTLFNNWYPNFTCVLFYTNPIINLKVRGVCMLILSIRQKITKYIFPYRTYISWLR